MTSRAMREDENDAYERPGRRTRPRTKDRPTYPKAESGMIITVDRGRFTILIDDREVSATKARQLGRTGVIVGDRVRAVGDTSGEEGTLARIVEVAERDTVLRRTADDDDPYERPIVANADQLVIVTALADPPPRTGMIDRILVAGFDAGIEPLLCLTKADLASPGRAGQPVRAAGGDRRGDLARDRSGSAAGPPGGPPQRLRRPFRGRQVDPGQCLDPRCAAGDRESQRGDRAGPTDLHVGRRAAAARAGSGRRGHRVRLLGDRHPRGPLLRAQPRQPGTDHRRLRRPRRHHRRTARGAARTKPTRPNARSTSRPSTDDSRPARLASFRRMLGSGQ